LIGKIKEKGLTFVPTKVIVNEKGRIKLEVSLAKGKRAYEKKEVIKERERNRELRAELKRARR
jgi:SsrA-binding protein